MPCGLMARTSRTCSPSASPVNSWFAPQAWKGPRSSAHWNVASAWSDEKTKIDGEASVSGPETIVVSGAWTTSQVQRALERGGRVVAGEGEGHEGFPAAVHGAGDGRRPVHDRRLGDGELDDRPLVAREGCVGDRVRIEDSDLERLRAERHAGVGLGRLARGERIAAKRALEDEVGAALGVEDEGRGAALGRILRPGGDRHDRRDAADLPLVLSGGRIDVAGGIAGTDHELVV